MAKCGWRECCVKDPWKGEIDTILGREDHVALLLLAQKETPRVLRYLCGRLYSDSEEEKWRAVRALGGVVADGQIVSRQQATELLRRFLWALNDESGTVPYGIPEAIGEILAVRPDLQGDFLPMLCSLATTEGMIQTGAIERGALWALGRVGQPVARCSPEAVEAVRVASMTHPDPETREIALRSLRMMSGSGSLIREQDR